MRFKSSLIVVAALMAVAMGCQHVPSSPLELDSYATALAERPMHLAPARAYAEALGREHAHDEAVFDLDDGVDLHEAEAIALTYNHTIRSARLEVEHALNLARVSGRWDDPEVGLSGGRRRTEGGSQSRELTVEPSADSPTGASYGFRREVERTVERAWVRSASLSITLPVSGRIGAERRAAEASVDTARLMVAETEWQTRLALREAWAAWSGTIERKALLDTHLSMLAPFVEAAEALRLAGEVLPSDARLFAIEHGRLAAHAERMDFEIGARHSEIMLILGLLPDAPVHLVPSIHLGEAPEAIPDLPRHLAETHPVLQRLRAEYELAENNLRVELRRQYPDITLSPAYTDERDETSLVLGLGVPVPVWNANREGIAEAVAARDRARARAEQALEQLISETTAMQAQWQGARAHRGRLAEQLAPMVDAQLDELQALLRVGEVELPLFHQAMVQALEIKTELLEVTVAEQLAMARVAGALAPARPVSPETMEMQP